MTRRRHEVPYFRRCVEIESTPTCAYHWRRYGVPNFFPRLRASKSATAVRHDADYKRFLRGEVYLEIKVWHQAVDGAETTARLANNVKFYLGS